MSWRGPTERKPFPSLGWDILEWMYHYLPSPSNVEEPLVLTDEQARLVLRWYEIDPATEEFVHRRGRLEMAKGWGKSPLLAAVSLVEFIGPAKFVGWDAQGEPKGEPWQRPIVEIAAVSEDQTDNTYSALYEMLTANENASAKRLGIDIGRTRLYIHGRPGTLRPVTASSGSREGARLTFAVLDETHLWTRSNGGVKLAGTLRRNAAKMDGRTFETTNAPVLGEKSVAEASGTDVEPGVLHVARRPAIEPTLDWPESDLRQALVETYGDAYWAPIERIIAEIADPATSWDDALRFYFNIRTAGVARAVDPRQWDRLAVPRDVPEGTPIGLGFDGSDYHDPTVLRGCTDDGYSFLIGSWVRPLGVADWHVPREEVHQAVASAFARFKVGRMYCDPPRWRDEIDTWEEMYGKDAEDKPRVLALDTNQATRMAPIVDRWLTAVRAGTHTHDGDEFTSDQVKATRLKKVRLADAEDDRTMYMFEKDGRIGNDSTVADALAFEAAMTMAALAIVPQPMYVYGKAR
jgi:hypothetical protein